VIQTRNYCTHAIESLAKWSWAFSPSGPSDKLVADVKSMTAECCVLLNRAEKFLLPEWGRIFDQDEMAVMSDLPTMNRLPYPVIAAEYECDYEKHNTMLPGELQSTRRISLNVEEAALAALAPFTYQWIRNTRPQVNMERPELDIGFVCIPICYFEPTGGLWVPPPAVAIFRSKDRPQDHITDVVITPLGQDAYSMFPLEQRLRRAQRDVNDECIAAIHLLLGLSLDRVTHTTIPAPSKLNKKRARSGKPLLYEYKVLDIVSDLMASPREVVGRPHGSHASPRMHKRRGHLRRLSETRVTWVRNTIVGKPGRGEITKDYSVQKAETTK
jgi:hypothetical protein